MNVELQTCLVKTLKTLYPSKHMAISVDVKMYSSGELETRYWLYVSEEVSQYFTASPSLIRFVTDLCAKEHPGDQPVNRIKRFYE